MFSALYRLIMRIINWFRNLFKRKKKEQEEEKKEKKVDTTKITPMTFVKGAVDVGVSIYNQNHTKKVEKIEDVEKKIEQIKKQLDTLSKEEGKKKLIELNEKLDLIKKTVKDNSTCPIKTINEQEKEIKKIETNKQVVEQLQKHNDERPEPVVTASSNLSPETINTINSAIAESKTGSLAHDLKLSPQVEQIISTLGININQDTAHNELQQYKKYVKESNKVLKESKNELKELTNEISINLTNNKLDRNKIKVEEIKSKIEKIKSLYYEFKHSDYIFVLENDFELNELDEFKIIKSEESIDLYLAKCDLLINTIEEKKTKQINITDYGYTKEESPKPVLTKTVKEEKEPEKVVMTDIEIASNTVKKDIEKQKNSIDRMMRKLDNMPVLEQRKRRLGFFDNILGNTIRIGLSLLPLRLIKNRPLGLLVTGFMLNNSIRSMRRVVTSVEINYIELNRRVRTQIDIINDYDTICNDSLYQISCLKDEFERTYGYESENPEVKRALAKLDMLETQVINQQSKLQDTKERIHQKVKKLERDYK